MKNLTILATAILLTACGGRFAGTQYDDVIDGVQQAADTTKVVCNTAQILSDQGLEIPGVEQCKKIVEKLNRDEVLVIFAVLNCASEYDVKDKEFAKCAVDVGWEPVCERIIELSGK